MNVDNMAMEQLREVRALLDTSKQLTDLDCVGKFVIVRSRNEGVNAGTVVSAEKGCVVLSQARRIWYHKPKDPAMAWYEGVANSGLSIDSKISVPVHQKCIVEDYSLTMCADTAKKSIEEHKAYGQSD